MSVDNAQEWGRRRSTEIGKWTMTMTDKRLELLTPVMGSVSESPPKADIH